MSIIGHIDLFCPPLKILTFLLYLDPKSTPIHGNCIPLTTHSCSDCGWKFPCISMAWRLLIDLTENMCMTHTLNIPYMVKSGHLKVNDGNLTLLACLPHSPQSGLKFGWRNIKSMSVYLASYIFQIYLKKKWKKYMETEGNSVFIVHWKAILHVC